MARAGVGQRALGGVVDSVEGGDERLVVGRVEGGQLLVDVVEHDRGGIGKLGTACAMLRVIAIMTAAGVPWPLTSAIKMPQRLSERGKKS